MSRGRGAVADEFGDEDCSIDNALVGMVRTDWKEVRAERWIDEGAGGGYL